MVLYKFTITMEDNISDILYVYMLIIMDLSMIMSRYIYSSKYYKIVFFNRLKQFDLLKEIINAWGSIQSYIISGSSGVAIDGDYWQ